MQLLPPNISSRLFTISGFLVGYALIDNLTANEQNAIGNWFMLVGQTLETASAQQQVNEERENQNNTNNSQSNNSNFSYTSNSNNTNNNRQDNLDIKRLEKIIKIMQIEIEKLKNLDK